MRKKGRFGLALLTTVLMLSTVVFTPVALAVEEPSLPTATVAETPKVTLEEAISTVKNHFEVPEKFENFNSAYDTYNNNQAWTLNWNGDGENQGHFMATVNALNGDVLNVRCWDWGQEGATGLLPKITREEAQGIGSELLTRLLGERMGELRLMPEEETIETLGVYGSNAYTLQYQRFINEVPFLNNSVSVEVSKANGRIMGYHLRWDEVQAPDAEGVLAKNQAETAFAKSSDFKLIYWQPVNLSFYAAEQEQETKLVYRLAEQNGGAIDAYTGEPLKLEQGSYLTVDGLNAMYNYSYAGSALLMDEAALTPQEQQEIERAAQMLTQDEAEAAVRKNVEIPASLVLNSVSLGRGNFSDQRVWNFTWSSMGALHNVGDVEYIMALVDAMSGDLVGFQRYYGFDAEQEIVLDEAAGQKVAEDFLRKIQPEKFRQTSLADSTQSTYEVFQHYGSENTPVYYFHRTSGGIDFPDNGMMVTVDLMTGNILSYSLNWSNFKLPVAAGILSKEQGVKKYLEENPLTLAYVQPYTYGSPGNVRLVYLPLQQNAAAPGSYVLDAKSGALLDFSGQPLKERRKPYIFTDLAGVDGAAEIAAFGKAGLFGEFGNSFNPQELITVGSLLRAMYFGGYAYYDNVNITDGEIMKKAKEMDWVKEEIKPEDPLSRELLAKLLIRYMGEGKMAEVKDIYQVSFADAGEISADALGYIALATGSGVLQVEGQILAPQENVSRAEAALALFKAMGWWFSE